MDHIHNRPTGVDQESSDWALTALASIGDAVIVSNTKGKITFMNPVAESLTGWSLVEAKGRDLIDIFHIVNEQSRLLTKNPVERVLKERIIVGLANHTILIRKDGSETPIDDSAAPIRNKSGTMVGVVLVFRDISERREKDLTIQNRTHTLDERVKELNCLYTISQIIEQPDLTLEAALQEIVDIIPPAWQYPDITCARLQIEGQDFKTTTYVQTLWKQTNDIFIKGDHIGMVEVCYVEEKPILDEGPFLKEERILIQAIAEYIGRIIERTKIEEALKEHSENLELLVEERTSQLQVKDKAIEMSINAIALTDLTGNLTYVNPSFLTMWGYSAEQEVLEQPLITFWENEEEIVEILQALQDKGNWIGELIAIKKDLSRFSVQLSANMVPDKFGTPSYIMTSFVDISEKKLIEEKLIQSEKLTVLGQLASGVGHELRNTLTSIKNAVYFLNMVLQDPASEVKESLEILDTEMAMSERIISRLLDFATPKLPSRYIVEIQDIIQKSWLQITIPEQIDVITQLDLSIPSIMADPNQLIQVFENLLLNAIQAMPTGGKLTIKSEVTQPEWVDISIIDTGVGISQENMQSIFEPLYTTKSRSIGLGLALSMNIIQGHGGNISVQSKVDQGSTFTIHLPIK